MAIINQINNGDTGFQARTIINSLVDLANSTSGSGFPYTGSANISGSLDVTNGVAADLFMHPQTITSDTTIPSYYNGFLIDPVSIGGTINIEPSANLLIIPSNFDTASYALNTSQAESSSYALTASYLIGGVSIDTGSLATTGSNIFIGDQKISGSLTVTGSTSFRLNQGSGIQIINLFSGTNNSGYALSLGVNDDGVNFSNNSSLRGFNFKNASGTLFSIGSSGILSGSKATITSITGSLYGTASYAITASYALNGGGGNPFPFTGSANITGSSEIIGNIIVKSTPTEVYPTINTNTYQLGVPFAAGLNIGPSIDWFNRYLYDNTGASYSIDWSNRYLYDNISATSVDWTNRLLYDSTGTALSIDWASRWLYDSSTSKSIDWFNRYLYDSTGTALSIDWSNRYLFDSTGTSYSIDWSNRYLYDPVNVISTDWANRYLYDITGINPSINWGSRLLYDQYGAIVVAWDNLYLYDRTGITPSIDWNYRTLYDSNGNPVLNYSGSGTPITFTGTSSYATYAETASFAQVMTLQSYDPLPSSPTGTIAVSASTPPKPYFYDGTTWNALY